MAHLFSELIWNINETYSPTLAQKLFKRMAPTVNDILPDGYRTKLEVSVDVAKYYNQYFTRNYSNDQRILVLPIIGEMSRYSYWTYGNELLANLLESAKSDGSYSGCVLKISTQGGTADSCAMLADAINNFRASKPLLVQANQCYSAGYFAASQADEIWLEDSAATGIGSISSLIIYENYQKQNEMQGVDVELIRADGGEKKALINPFEPLTDELRAVLKEQANAARKEFVGYVKRGRVGKITNEEVFSGSTYNVKQALELGLADKVGSLAAATKRCLQLSKSY